MLHVDDLDTRYSNSSGQDDQSRTVHDAQHYDFTYNALAATTVITAAPLVHASSPLPISAVKRLCAWSPHVLLGFHAQMHAVSIPAGDVGVSTERSVGAPVSYIYHVHTSDNLYFALKHVRYSFI